MATLEGDKRLSENSSESKIGLSHELSRANIVCPKPPISKEYKTIFLINITQQSTFSDQTIDVLNTRFQTRRPRLEPPKSKIPQSLEDNTALIMIMT